MKKRKTKNSLTALVMVHIATLADKSSHQRKCQVWKKKHVFRQTFGVAFDVNVTNTR